MYQNPIQHDLNIRNPTNIHRELKLVLLRQNGVFVLLLLKKFPQRACCWLHWYGIHRLYLAHLVCVLFQSICCQRKIMDRVHQFVLADASKRDIMREIFCVALHHGDGGTEIMGDGGAELAPLLHHSPGLLIIF